eukprot:NODE_436_length_1698_cov_64.612492_g318_i0.p1 GENE.NODE_436_length_1698_cov_64.612492_g318_i0~~NODE_436_length_1698_cov_64.612492_g318_i0.p1  ORF type:complete len:522 (-),score=178.90 NODE_436_length_1698_cov_64.612492_g318_i0:133-1647(-)
MHSVLVPLFALWWSFSTCSTTPPNFVFILTDDWGWGDIGAHHSITHPKGLNKPRTPNIDQLAKEGTLFTQFHTMGAECSPSRASFMTGRSPSDKKVRIHLVIDDHHDTRGSADFLDPKTATVTSVLQSAGYSVGHYGKWHLGSFTGNTTAKLPPAPPLKAYGIDDSVSYSSNADVNPGFPHAGQSTNPFSDPWFPSNSSRQIVDYGIDFIEKAQQAQKPFYLNLWFHISHAPMWPTDEQLRTFPTSDCPGPNPGHNQQRCAVQVFRASQFEADAQIGRFTRWLDSQPALRNTTLVVFATDNGPEDPHEDMHAVGDPGPFRGRKRSLYEGGIRVPFITRWPGTIPAKRVSSGDVASVDWMPTVASLAGVPLTPDQRAGLLGRDATSVLLGHGPAPRATPKMFDYRYDNSKFGYCYHGAPRLALVQDNLKLLFNPDPRFPRTELFNLSASTFESDNLATDPRYAARVETMRKTLTDWMATLDPISPVLADFKHLGCAEFEMPTGEL